jgi:hypothetical protein
MAFSLASVRATLRSAFPSVTLLPGIEVRFLASTEPGRFDSLSWEQLESNRAAIGIETTYVRDYFLRYTMSPERMAFLRESLDRSRSPEINTDTRPSGYFRRTLLQGSLDRSRITRGLDALSHGVRLPLLLGVITVLLYSTGYLHGDFHVPHWVALSCYVAIGLGTLTGGWRIIETMGTRITKLSQHQGFSASAGGSVMLFVASYLGIPVSTTHTITGCVIGAGAARRASAVRWGVAGNVMVAWLITIPASATVAAIFYWIASALG